MKERAVITNDRRDGAIIKKGIHGISIIICCYNSAGRLPRTLACLLAQQVPTDFHWEILLVNNASTDNTVTVAQAAWDQNKPLNAVCRVVEEPNPGQYFARKKGALEARYEVILFCDDDNLLDPHYVYTAARIIEQDKNIGAAGGQIHPVTDAPEWPSWFNEYKDKYATGIPAPQSGDVSHRGFVLGAGMVTRRQLFLQVFDERYPSLLNGRNGYALSTGDDFEYCMRLLLWGYSLYYEQGLQMQHFIPQSRLTIAYRDRLMQGIIASREVLTEYDKALILQKRNQHKNKWRLLLLAPFRIWLVRMGWSRRSLIDEQLVLFYLSPFHINEGPVRTTIKRFINRQ